MSDRALAARRLCPVLMIGGTAKRYCDRQCAWWSEQGHGCTWTLLGDLAHKMLVELEKKEYHA